MTPVLATDIDLPALLEKGGMYGLLLVCVYILGRLHLKSMKDKDAQIAEAQKREAEYVAYRETSMTTLGDHFRATQAIAIEVKRMGDELAKLRQSHESHEKLCDERRRAATP